MSEQRCPVCDGKGELTRLRARGDCEVSPYSKGMFLCHRCKGQGTIQDLLPMWTVPPTGVAQPNTGGGGINTTTPFISYESVTQAYEDVMKIADENGGSLDLTGENNDIIIEGNNCACSPDGEPHNEDCKGYTW